MKSCAGNLSHLIGVNGKKSIRLRFEKQKLKYQFPKELNHFTALISKCLFTSDL